MTELSRTFFALAILGLVGAHASVVTTGLEGKSEEIEDVTDADLSIRELINKYGYAGETHRVITEDSYLLDIHRITGSMGNPSAEGKPPVLLIHPLLGSSIDWIITGPGKALGYILADAGYDVWLGNFRGNHYARKSLNYTTYDKQFWQFSWHESGVYDLPSMIDYILEKTQSSQLSYVGHSQGTTAFWVMASQRPEYEDKVNAMFALAPVAYMTHTRSPFYQILSRFGYSIEKLTSLLGYNEFEPTSKIVKYIASIVCKGLQPTCTNVMFLIGGASKDQLDTEMLPAILAHVPSGGSVKQILHYFQVLKAHKFRKYDYGVVKNLLEYKQMSPPSYSLSSINVPVHLYYSSGDRFATSRDVDRLYQELGNPISNFKVSDNSFAHLDFMWGKDAKELVYDNLLSEMEKYKH